MQKVFKLLRRANDGNNFNRETEVFMAMSHISNVSSHNRIAQQEVIDVCLMLVQQDIAWIVQAILRKDTVLCACCVVIVRSNGLLDKIYMNGMSS